MPHALRSLIMLSVALCTAAFGASQAEVEKGFVRAAAPSFELPPLDGARYRDTIPDTLDLAAMAELAINGLCGPNDPNVGYELFFTVNLQRNPPIMLHDFSDENWSKFLGTLPLMRVITGSETYRDLERKIVEARLRCIDEQGLYHQPFSGKPWIEENLWPEAKSKEPHGPLPPYEGGRISPRVLEGLIVYARLAGAPFKALADGMALNGTRGGLENFVKTTDEYGLAPGTPDSAIAKGFLGCDAWTPQALCQYYRWSGNKLALAAAGKIIRCQKERIDYFDSSGKFILTTPGVAPAHFHAHSLSILGFLEYALATHDDKLAAYCRTAYAWARAQGNAATGFFPENILPDYPNSEGCCIADMVALAIALSEAGLGDYWDDADRWIRNMFAESQLTPEKGAQLARAAAQRPVQKVAYNETAHRVIERNIGAFAGWPGANEWVYKLGIQHCCTGNCVRAIYYAWERAVELKDGALRVNLLLNRAAPWADVYSAIPYEGKVALRMKQACAKVAVRMPEWIAAGSKEVACAVNGVPQSIAWDKRYVTLGAVKANDKIEIAFPIVTKTSRERIGGKDYTLTIKGTTVIGIDPPGKECPLFDRAKYKSDRAPMVQVDRYVAANALEF